MRLRNDLLFSILLPILLPLTSSTQLPLVIWHGLGDTFTNPSLLSLTTLAANTNPNTSTYLIHLSPSSATDRTSTFLGHLPTQLSTICTTLSTDPSLSGGFNALGLSQGGQFLRGLIETCPTLPRVGTLITLGSQHSGISRFVKRCDLTDWVCELTVKALNTAKWGRWAQRNVVPAQYFRDPRDSESFLRYSGWLADVNNERPGDGEDGREREEGRKYKERLVGRLGRLVMLMWRDDETVVPKESAWFADVYEDDDEEEGDDGEGKRRVVWLNQTQGYKDDWIGMRTLDEEGRLEFLEVEGGHMEIGEELARELMWVYFGPDGKRGEWKWSPPKEDERRVEEVGWELR
ncbi:alpha/beta-hydrolase [Ascodesmis nigricans]|uniref:Palmitoyl-protein thioesterase 1 n=1 Tax=Ascodesmis nigricans TaxID=341454 RepID=A0A4S2MQU2_9PEZI|nr:alpha/beta-hydrolase [Ascodesmis nigricans]